MKKIYTNESHFLVHNIKNLLEAEGIDVFVKNEFAQGAMGEVSVFDTWPELWVADDHDVERATELVRLAQSSKKGATDWVCEHCSEPNDASFEICWNCQQEHL